MMIVTVMSMMLMNGAGNVVNSSFSCICSIESRNRNNSTQRIIFGWALFSKQASESKAVHVFCTWKRNGFYWESGEK